MARSVTVDPLVFAYSAIGLTCTYVILLGTILALAVEMKERGKPLSNKSFVDAEAAHALLHQYSEWWDSYSNAITYDPNSTHDDLVNMFLSTRGEEWWPQVGTEPEGDGVPGPTGTPLPGVITEQPFMPVVGSGSEQPWSFQDTGRLEVLPDPPIVFNPRADRALSALEYATRWASTVAPNATPQDIVEAAKRYENFLEGVNEDGSTNQE